jgi:penicillin V acylase-like amidase (Ntn superfamily)
MDALEFSTKIEDGIIRLPQQFEAYENAFVRIIILSEKPKTLSKQKEKLKKAFKGMESVTVFQAIANPVKWQKQLRDEWE